MINENILAAKESLAKVRGHCMAHEVLRKREHLIVLFPAGYRLDGVRVSMAHGLTAACGKALEKMEAVWNGGV